MRTISVSSNARLFLAHIPHGSTLEEISDFLKTKAFSFAHISIWGESDSAVMELMTPEVHQSKTFENSLITFRAEGFLAPEDTMRLYGWLSFVEDGQWTVYHGILRSARILSAEARIEAYAETVVDRVENPIFGSMVWRNAAARKLDSKAKRSGSGVSVPTLGATATSRFEKERSLDASGEDEYKLRPGDVIVHHSFGECEVIQFLDAEDVVLLRVKGPPSREVRLALRVLKLEKVGESGDGKITYKAHPRGR